MLNWNKYDVELGEKTGIEIEIIILTAYYDFLWKIVKNEAGFK